MAKRNSFNSAGWKAAKFTYRTADKAVGGLFRFATTDHTGMARRLSNMPPMGFLETIRYVFSQVLITIVGAVLTGFLVFLFFAYGVPFLISGGFE